MSVARGRRQAGPPAARRPRAPQRRDDLGGDQVEGRQAVLELLVAARRAVHRVTIADQQEPSEILDAIERAARDRRIPISHVSRARLDREARTEGNQGVYARCEPVDTVAIDTLCEAASGQPFLLVCDGITDPRNLGALLRSAECAGVTGVVLPSHRSARLTPAVTKTAAGAIEHLSFCAVGGVPSALGRLREQAVVTVGLAPEARTSLYDLDLASPVAIVIGGEERGLGRLTRARCDELVSIPQHGAIASLNAGVAGAVACFEVARQRRAPTKRRAPR